MDRHESQVRILKSLARMRRFIEDLPPDARVNWYSDNYGIWLDVAIFRERYRGRTATLNKNGILSLEDDGILVQAVGEQPPAAPVEEVVL